MAGAQQHAPAGHPSYDPPRPALPPPWCRLDERQPRPSHHPPHRRPAGIPLLTMKAANPDVDPSRLTTGAFVKLPDWCAGAGLWRRRTAGTQLRRARPRLRASRSSPSRLPTRAHPPYPAPQPCVQGRVVPQPPPGHCLPLRHCRGRRLHCHHRRGALPGWAGVAWQGVSLGWRALCCRGWMHGALRTGSCAPVPGSFLPTNCPLPATHALPLAGLCAGHPRRAGPEQPGLWHREHCAAAGPEGLPAAL